MEWLNNFFTEALVFIKGLGATNIIAIVGIIVPIVIFIFKGLNDKKNNDSVGENGQDIWEKEIEEISLKLEAIDVELEGIGKKSKDLELEMERLNLERSKLSEDRYKIFCKMEEESSKYPDLYSYLFDIDSLVKHIVNSDIAKDFELSDEGKYNVRINVEKIIGRIQDGLVDGDYRMLDKDKLLMLIKKSDGNTHIKTLSKLIEEINDVDSICADSKSVFSDRVERIIATIKKI